MSTPLSVIDILSRTIDGDEMDIEIELMRVRAVVAELIEACKLARHICEPGNALQQQIDAAIAKATGDTHE